MSEGADGHGQVVDGEVVSRRPRQRREGGFCSACSGGRHGLHGVANGGRQRSGASSLCRCRPVTVAAVGDVHGGYGSQLGKRGCPGGSWDHGVRVGERREQGEVTVDEDGSVLCACCAVSMPIVASLAGADASWSGARAAPLRPGVDGRAQWSTERLGDMVGEASSEGEQGSKEAGKDMAGMALP